MRKTASFRLIVWAAFCACCVRNSVAAQMDARLNVLFIAADDLRNDLPCYGDTIAQTPHLDRLAKRGVVFHRAYCQQALCNPSRASLMTGRRPDTLRIWDLPTHFRDVLPQVVTLPQHFKQHGYFTQNIGKIYHNWRQNTEGDPESWSTPAMLHYNTHYADVAVVAQDTLPPSLTTAHKTECRDVPDDAYFDGRVAAEAVQALKKMARSRQPFFLAVGFWKPHLPFNAPKRYWDLYRREDIPLPATSGWPRGTNRIAWHNSRELLSDKGRKVELSDDDVRELRHGYYAGISYLDAQLGKLLDELDRQGLAESTVIVFWSDHGFHLGEHTLWCKTSNFELDARVPLIISVPGLSRGADTQALAELVDLYPTLVELCGLPPADGLEGTSLVPVLHDPTSSVKSAAVTQHPRPAYYRDTPEHMGYSLRTRTDRYTEWRDCRTGDVVAREFYDHERDGAETRNLADDAAYTEIISRRRQQLASMVESPFPRLDPRKRRE